MRIKPLHFQGAFLIQLDKICDKRGYFARIFCEYELQSLSIKFPVRQANCSYTETKGAIRGLHFQYPPHSEKKIVRCIHGAVFDVMVDLRRNSPTFLQWYGVDLSAENGVSLLIPEGVAHGFQTVSNNCEMVYFHSTFYAPDHEGSIRYNDPLIAVSWPLPVAEVSVKDKNGPLLTSSFEGIQL